MTDRPVIFSAPMVRALLEGRKTQTRRLAWNHFRACTTCGRGGRIFDSGTGGKVIDCPRCEGTGLKPTIWQKAQPGDRLWVRETASWPLTGGEGVVYAADWPPNFDVPRYAGSGGKNGWRPSIHMPRWASRITLVVTDVRRERVQEISANDVGAEGFRLGLRNRGMPSPSDFVSAWNSIHGPEAWDRNDEVVALTFTVHHRNIDNMQEAA